ncbi:NIPSNAP family protein [Streptomyces sp. NPDC002643]
MRIYDLRTYTLASREDLDFYKDVVYAKHIPSAKLFGIEIHGAWTSPSDDEPRLYILASNPEGSDPAEVGMRFVSSPEFQKDLEGFDMAKILHVDSVLLDPTAISPLQ